MRPPVTHLAIGLALGLIAHTPAPAQDTGPASLPITIHGVYVYVNATVNDKPATLVLDSGAGINVITPEAAKRLGVEPGKDLTNVNGAGGAAPPVRTAVIGSIGVGATRTTNQPAALIPLPDALPCDGLIGTPFFRRWVVTIDYAKSRLTLTDPPSFRPPGGAVPFPLRFKDETPHVEASADGRKGWFMIDTGAGDSVTLFAPFVEKQQLRGKYSPAIRTVTGRGVGGLIYGEVTRLPEFAIGDFRLKRPTVTLS